MKGKTRSQEMKRKIHVLPSIRGMPDQFMRGDKMHGVVKSFDVFFRKMMLVFSGMFFLSSPVAQAGGSLGYDDLEEKFPDNLPLFVGLDQMFDISDGAYADIRIMYHNDLDEAWNDLFVGERLGPYTVCAREKRGEHRVMQITLTTEFFFFDKNGDRSKYPQAESVGFEETLTGMSIIPVEKEPEKAGSQDCSYLYTQAP